MYKINNKKIKCVLFPSRPDIICRNFGGGRRSLGFYDGNQEESQKIFEECCGWSKFWRVIRHSKMEDLELRRIGVDQTSGVQRHTFKRLPWQSLFTDPHLWVADPNLLPKQKAYFGQSDLQFQEQLALQFEKMLITANFSYCSLSDASEWNSKRSAEFHTSYVFQETIDFICLDSLIPEKNKQKWAIKYSVSGCITTDSIADISELKSYIIHSSVLLDVDHQLARLFYIDIMSPKTNAFPFVLGDKKSDSAATASIFELEIPSPADPLLSTADADEDARKSMTSQNGLFEIRNRRRNLYKEKAARETEYEANYALDC